MRPPTRSAPSANPEKPSPPATRKSLAATRKRSPGAIRPSFNRDGPGRDVLSLGRVEAIAVREPARDLEDRRHARTVELLFEQATDRVSRERHHRESVAERLNGIEIGVGQIAAVLRDQVGADAAGVHEGDDCPAVSGSAGRRELRIGDHVAERRLARSILRARNRTSDRADALIGHRRSQLQCICRRWRFASGPLATSRVTMTFRASVRTIAPLAGSIDIVTRVKSRPNAPALVTVRPPIRQL